MDVAIRELGSVHVLELDGQLDGTTSPDVQEQILALLQPGSQIILDLSRVPYMSSAGLRVLLVLARQVEATGSRLVLVGLVEEVRDTMSITGFLGFFTACETLADALAFLETAEQ
jgi:anti-sigma B factor antagonist